MTAKACVLLASEHIEIDSALGRATGAIADELKSLNIAVIASHIADDAASLVATDPSFEAILVDWSLGGERGGPAARQVIFNARERNARRPVFLLLERGSAATVPIEVMRQVDEIVWLLEDTPLFASARPPSAM